MTDIKPVEEPLRHLRCIENVLDNIKASRADNEPFNIYALTANDYIYLQVSVMAADTDDPFGPKSLQKSRKWLLSKWMTVTEIVETAWKAIEGFELHELKERFTYKGACVYNSHIDIEERVKIAGKVDIRD